MNKKKEIRLKFLINQFQFDEYMNNKRYEKLLDIINGKYGTKEALCIFCRANKYEGNNGIVHNNDCIIVQLRRNIKNYENNKK